MSVYSIKDLEHLSGIKAHTIRIWEQRHKLFSPKRTDTNIRFYNEEDLRLILNISLLKNHGIKISKIVEMSSEQINEEVIALSQEEHSNEDQINALTLAMLELNEEFFNKTLKANEARIGFEKTMTEIIYPFFKKIGILWLANSINPAQEHFITHLVRQRIIVETEKLIVSSNAPRFLLFLPEDELHELGLLYANYILRLKGFQTYYLGQSLPINSLEEIYHHIDPKYLFTVLTSKPSGRTMKKYLDELHSKFKETTIFITGYQVVGQNIELKENFQLINQFDDLAPTIESLEPNSVSQGKISG